MQFSTGLRVCLVLLGACSLAVPGQAGNPTLRQVSEIQQPSQVKISPDGTRVAWITREVDWHDNRLRAQLWVQSDGRTTHIDEVRGFRGGFSWTPDSRWIAYIHRDRRPGLRLVRWDGLATMGPFELPSGTRDFAISPNGSRLALVILDAESSDSILSRELFGRHEVKGEGYRMSHLWVSPLTLPSGAEDAAAGLGVARRLTDGTFTVGNFAWSPDGQHIAFDHAPDPESNSRYSSDLSVMELSSSQTWTVAQESGYERGPVWSPDGTEILYSSAMGVAVSNLPAELLAVPFRGGTARRLSQAIETEPQPVGWTDDGVWVLAEDRTAIRLYRIDSRTTEVSEVKGLPEIVREVTMSASGEHLAVRAASRNTLEEVYVGDADSTEFQRISDYTEQVEGWPLGTREIISWRAEDGLEIEGVLLKPDGFDPSHQYPLMVVVHGGPRSADRPTLYPGNLYPITQWLGKGAIVLRPNYRGGTGYGPEFRRAHHRNVGPGDAMDVLAGVDYLISQGYVDKDRIGLMGWSYGGFVSAYLTATSDRFAAISVGAGISDWRTHYAWEDANITTKVFSFGISPWEDPDAWAKASPITHIRGAQTPTLIQHMVADPVVSVLSAYELYQALLDLGVETRFVEFPSATHGPADPKALLAVAWQNYEWFSKKIWREVADRATVIGSLRENGR